VNELQKKILQVGALVLAATTLYPPWIGRYNIPMIKATTEYAAIEYQWIHKPPARVDRAAMSDAIELLPSNVSPWSARIDLERWSIQAIAIIGLTLVAYLTNADRKESSENEEA
jgi:hypothetical protein